MNKPIHTHQTVNFDAHQNPDGNSVIGGAIHQLTHNILNKAKRNAINAQSQIDLARKLAQLMEALVGDFNQMMDGLFLDPPIISVGSMKKLGKDLNALVGEKHHLGTGLNAQGENALKKECDNAISMFKKSLLSVLPNNFKMTIKQPSGGEETFTVKDPIKTFIEDILNGNGELSTALIQQYATKEADLINTYLKTMKNHSTAENFANFINEIANALEDGAQSCMASGEQVISLSEIMAAKLNWAVNIMQEIMSTASKFADKAFKVELQMQGRIRAN